MSHAAMDAVMMLCIHTWRLWLASVIRVPVLEIIPPNDWSVWALAPFFINLLLLHPRRRFDIGVCVD